MWFLEIYFWDKAEQLRAYTSYTDLRNAQQAVLDVWGPNLIVKFVSYFDDGTNVSQEVVTEHRAEN